MKRTKHRDQSSRGGQLVALFASPFSFLITSAARLQQTITMFPLQMLCAEGAAVNFTIP